MSQSKVTGGAVLVIPNPEPQKQVIAGVGGSVSISSSALPSGAATASNQTSGAQKAQILDSAAVAVFPVWTDLVLDYTSGNLDSLIMMNGVATVKTLTFTYTGGNLTNIAKT